jgi:hypothetical protein
MEKNIFTQGFLLRNGFTQHETNVFSNKECTLTVHDSYYEIQFDKPEVGEVTMYTDNWSIPQLVGILTWHDLIDRNYVK